MNKKKLWQIFSTGLGTGFGFGTLWLAAGNRDVLFIVIALGLIIAGYWLGYRRIEGYTRD